MSRIITIASLFLPPLSVMAGGGHFPIKITKFSNNGTEFSFKASPVIEERKWMDSDCLEIVISGTYDTLKWLTYKGPMSKAGHIQSIEALKKANESKNKINFGYIGYGLHKLDSCIYESKALIYENGNVYSIYTRI